MKRATAGALLALTLVFAACKADDKSPQSAPAPVRDTVRIGVWMSPEPGGATYGGAATRTLIYPQLFRATPGGGWAADVIEPGSDRTAANGKSARLKLRANARWSDGTRITVDDLRRTMDTRFVTAVESPTSVGTIVLRFTQALPGWRRLWSGLDVIAPPKEGVYGGPYTLGPVTTGLETVLLRNERYYGTRPAIREVHLVLAPDPEIATRLMERGELDVIAPPAFSARTARLRRVKNAQVLVGRSDKGGWTAAIVANPSRLAKDQRVALLSLVDRKRFTDVLLRGEATAAGPSTASVAPAPTSQAVPSLGAPVEAPQLALMLQAMQRLGRERGFTFELRQAEFGQVLGAYARSDFDALVRLQPGSPTRCWTCELGSVNPALAAAADAGDRGAADQLRGQLVDDALVLPLWRERPVVAVRDGLEGVTPNGFAASGPAWNIAAWRWSS